VYAYLYSRLGSADDASDVAQEVFVRVTSALRNGTCPTQPRHWLFKVAKNEMKVWVRTKKRREKHERASAPRMRTSEANETQSRIEVEDALRLLDEKCREAIVYVHMLGYSYQEAAELVGVPVSTMSSRVFHGRTKLREILGAQLDARSS